MNAGNMARDAALRHLSQQNRFGLPVAFTLSGFPHHSHLRSMPLFYHETPVHLRFVRKLQNLNAPNKTSKQKPRKQPNPPERRSHSPPDTLTGIFRGKVEKRRGDISLYALGSAGRTPGGIPPVSTTNNPYVNTHHRAASGLSPLRTANRTFNANSLRSNPARPARLRNPSSAFRLITTTTKHLNVLDRVFAAERVWNDVVGFRARRSATVSVVEDRVAAWAVCQACGLGLAFGLRCDAFPFAGPGA
nr:MAG TPA: hypothetical protein [Caudoviricetes sp.]